MKNTEQKKAAKEFVGYWKGKGYEKGESQPFWLSLLRDVLGVEQPEKFITFEDKVMLDHTSFIDGYIPSTHVLIEQKSCPSCNFAKIYKEGGGGLCEDCLVRLPYPYPCEKWTFKDLSLILKCPIKFLSKSVHFYFGNLKIFTELNFTIFRAMIYKFWMKNISFSVPLLLSCNTSKA